MKIFLVGMPGSGKTTLGKELASHLLVDFVDLDAEIERSEQKSISEIFKEEGEAYFRTLEAKLLREWAGSSTAFVMSTGGGAPCFYQGMDTINASGLSVFLDCPVSVLVDRVKRNQERPLLLAQDETALKEKLERIRNERMDCYRRAMIVLENPTLQELLKRIPSRS
jgi:shikimate kinase